MARTAPYDPMRGSLAEVRDRLIRIEEWGDRYWAAVANTLVALALELNAAQGKAIDTPSGPGVLAGAGPVGEPRDEVR
jgi:hypothetical protein